jgi:Bardet-Biedl syndrome 2 protein
MWQGFDSRGQEAYWTVTGDDVTALAFSDVNEDGQKELIVGSADYQIRVFHGEDVLSDVTEADAIVGTCFSFQEEAIT